MRNVLTLVLGGGRGTRLYPLTHYRSKPAVPLAGKYRLIDIPLSNCINSGLNRMYVLTQFNSVSLHRHIRRTYTFDQFTAGFVEILAAQQTLDTEDWYQGTADAVRQNLRYIDQAEYDYVLVLSGDQLYRMDYRKMIAAHQESKADVTIAAMPVDRQTARSMGLMRVDDDGRVAGFLEKPQTDEQIDTVRMEPAWIDARGIESHGRDCLASMGIYLFNRRTLVKLLTETNDPDFGRQIFPAAARSHRVQVDLFDGYWEDIGTIGSFYEANLALAAADRPFDLASAVAPIYTRARYLAPSRLDGATVIHSLLADGCEIEEGVRIENSVVGVRCKIGRDVTIRNSILLGNDDYESAAERTQAASEGMPPQGIGAGTVIERAIIDKNCRIGRNVRITNERGLESTEGTDLDTMQAVIRDRVICIQRGAVLPDEWSI
jgi:glucose-1-phosphate adenylyltransferase